MIVLAGTFNPVHAGHVKCVQDARAFLEASTTYTVVAGLLSPASFKKVVERIAKRKGAPTVASFEVRVCSHML